MAISKTSSPRLPRPGLSARDTLQRGRTKEQAATRDRDAVVHTVGELKMTEQDIRDYLDRGGPTDLATNGRAINVLDESIADLEQECVNVTAEANGLRAKMDNGVRRKKNMQVNYRKIQRDLAALEAASPSSRRATRTTITAD